MSIQGKGFGVHIVCSFVDIFFSSEYCLDEIKKIYTHKQLYGYVYAYRGACVHLRDRRFTEQGVFGISGGN